MVAATAQGLPGQIFITELMYHPVEEPAFNADGSPVLDLYEDVHEFVELHNAGTSPVALDGWELAGGIGYVFPSNAVIQAGAYLVVARDPARLEAVQAYRLPAGSVLGPYTGQLSNRRDTVRVRDGSGKTVEAVSYSAEFPWPISADGLGADDEWTGLKARDYQYRGRSLERVSLTHPASDPANWLASPLPGEPSPGRPNAVQRQIPQPVVVQIQVAQEADEARLIRNNEPVRITCGFSGTQDLANVRLEWFVDNLELTNESTQGLAMVPDGPASQGRFTAVLPGQTNRSIVRFRIRAERGTGDEVVSPRADDPFRWHAYFVTPMRASARPVYDCFTSTKSLAVLQANISQNPRRITSPDPPGQPRLAWNATEPAVMVHDGVVYDIRMRHHGSRYNRNAGRYSLKWQFPRYRKFNGVTGIFETDKGDDFMVGHGLFRAAGQPVSAVRYVDLYLNNLGVMQRLEQGEFDGDMLDDYHRTQQALNPGSELEASGEIYKNVGTIDMNGEGPYGRGDGRPLSKPPHWTDLQMYEWTFALQNHGWRGSYSWKQMMDAFWVARGDTPTRLNPNLPALRTFFTNHFDIDQMLTYIALENWCCPWDDTTQNHFFWQRRNGKWGMLPWDCDAWFGRGDNTPATASIFMGEVGDPNNNFRGPNFFKDAFIKAFRTELTERFFLLNNTFLHPDNLRALGFGSIASFAQQRMTSVNQQCGLGVFQRPGKPVNLAPAGGVTALPPRSLSASGYTHSASPAPPHARTVWEIRAASGSYLAPLWKLSSDTQLTSVPLPFEVLRFGERYFWRCTYYDMDGHPSLTADEVSFNFGPTSAETTLLAMDAATRWRYDQSGENRSAENWTALAYDDSGWAQGAAILGKEEAALPEPLRTPLTLGPTTYYFRKRFQFPGPPEGATVRARYAIDDGCIIYINGREWLRVRMPEGAVGHNTFASQTVGDATAEGPIEVPNSLFQRGENVVAVEVHQVNAASSDIVFGLSLEATLPAASGMVVLNEIAARNSGSVVEAGTTPDWIELFNNGTQTVELGGFSLSDDVLVPGKYVFPPETQLAARDFLVVWCDDRTNAPGLHTGFGLKDTGQTVALFGPPGDSVAVHDYVTFGLQAANFTLGRDGDGAGPWGLTGPTPGAPNVVQALAPAGSLCINEWMAAPESGDDWFELYNRAALPVALSGLHLTDDLNAPTLTQLADLSFVGPADYVKLLADENLENGADHVGFKLRAGGETIGLYATNGTTALDTVVFGPQQTGISEGRLPDGSPAVTVFPDTASPGDPNHLPLADAAINEVLAHSDPPLEDAIELVNTGSSAMAIGGWWLSDSRREPRKFQIPAGTTLSKGGFAVFYENEFNAHPGSPGSFALDGAHGDEVVLSAADADGNLTGHRTRVDFGATEAGVSVGRFATSQGYEFTALGQRTFGADTAPTVMEFRRGTGAPNSTARVGPVVISELMYQPPRLGTNDNRRDEFIELYNSSDQPVPLFDPAFPTNTWELRDAVEFAFPPGVTLPPRSALVVVSFDPVIEVTARTEFEKAYGTVAPLFGPYRGKLDNADDEVRLYRPDRPIALSGPEFGFVPYIRVERVAYTASAPWPSGADGTGASIHRIRPGDFGNEPANWKAATPSPGHVEDPANLAWRLGIRPDPAGGFTIIATGTGGAGWQAVLQGSSDLATWNDLIAHSAAVGTFEYADPQSGQRPARFYRVLLKP